MKVVYIRLVGSLGYFLPLLTAVLAVTLWQIADSLQARLRVEEADERSAATITRSGNIAEKLGLLGTVAGLVVGLAQIDPGAPDALAPLIDAMRLAFMTTYFGICVELTGKVYLSCVPYIVPLRVRKPAEATKELSHES